MAAVRRSAAAALVSAADSVSWHRLCAAGPELRLWPTLHNGQCFAWRRLAVTAVGAVKLEAVDDSESKQPQGSSSSAWVGEWIGVLGRSALVLRETGAGEIEFRCLTDVPNDMVKRQLQDYFQLEVKMDTLVSQWCLKDPRVGVIVKCLPGMRILRQDPFECLISFICSSNNHISRISSMLFKLRTAYGEKLTEIDGEALHAFPTAERLAAVPESSLRELGLGYRAKFVVETAKAVQTSGLDWLMNLRKANAAEVQQALIGLPGVGRKVADCVAVFSLDQTSAVPVDTHVWSIACRDMDASLQETKSLTPTVYNRVGQLFRDRYGEHAGWAHSIVFAAELKAFRSLLPPTLVDSMDAFRAETKAAKAAKTGKRTAEARTSTKSIVSQTRRSRGADAGEAAPEPPAKQPRRRRKSATADEGQ